jgi:diguanylate cyclase
MSAAALLCMSALAICVSGRHASSFRGHRWWCLAQAQLALACLGLVDLRVEAGESQALDVWRAGLQFAWVAWPLCMLAGLRRFYSRHEWDAPRRLDGAIAVAALAGSVLALVPALPRDLAMLLPALTSFAVLTYVAALSLRLHATSQAAGLQAFAALAVAAAALELVLLATLPHGPPGPTSSGLGWGAAIVMAGVGIAPVYMALALPAKRTIATLLTTQGQLRELADRDALTGLANRRHFQETVQRALRLRQAQEGGLLMLDVDQFKRINDRFGHAAGDGALQQVARSIRACVRDDDIAGRLGGDEFALWLVHASLDEAMAVALRIGEHLALRSEMPQELHLSVSCGLVQIEAGEALPSALHRADQALLEAKRQGRSRVVLALGDATHPRFTESKPMGLPQ